MLYTCFHGKDENIGNVILSVIYAILIPLIICVNLFSIFGKIKIKRNKFLSSQILFVTLILCDLTIGVVELPILIYVKWIPNDATCLEIQLGFLSGMSQVHMSANILCAISIQRYISVAHYRYYRSIVTKKVLTIAIILATLISTAWALFTALYATDQDTSKKAKFTFLGPLTRQ